MIKAGRKELLTVARISDYGLYLTDGEGEVLLPNRYISLSDKEGTCIHTMPYHDLSPTFSEYLGDLTVSKTVQY